MGNLDTQVKDWNCIFGNIPEETYLSHYGVLGMKWGIRKDRKNGSSEKRASKRKKRKKKLPRYSKKRIKSMSTKQIETRIKRLDLERKLSDMEKEDKVAGYIAVRDTLKQSGTRILGTVATGAGLYLIGKAITKRTGRPKLAEFIVRGGKFRK